MRSFLLLLDMCCELIQSLGLELIASTLEDRITDMFKWRPWCGGVFSSNWNSNSDGLTSNARLSVVRNSTFIYLFKKVIVAYDIKRYDEITTAAPFL